MPPSSSSSSRTVRRHPSAGNLDTRPALVRDGDQPVALVPASFPHGAEPSRELVQFGPDLDHEVLHKLVGPTDGRRILDLGCGAGAAAVALARRGARVIAVESSTARLAQARAAAEMAEVKVEFHHSDLADLAFLRADSIDSALAVYSLAGVQDLGRVFRQVHRILKPEAPFTVSLPHPVACMLEFDDEQQPPYLGRTAWSSSAVTWRAGGDEGITHVHQIGDVFTTLSRSNFRVDALLEPRAEGTARGPHSSPLDDWVPSTLIVRARKLGI